MQDPKKPTGGSDEGSDEEHDIGAEIDELEVRLAASKKTIDRMTPPIPAATTAAPRPVERFERPTSRNDVTALTIAAIDSKLDEARTARRLRQATPSPSTPPSKKPSK